MSNSKPSKEQIIHDLAISLINANNCKEIIDPSDMSMTYETDRLKQTLDYYRLYTEYLEKKWVDRMDPNHEMGFCFEESEDVF
jgi:hypothetical protein